MEQPHNPTNHARGVLLIALAAILWSSSGLFVKATTFADWPLELRGTILAFWRAFFAGILILPIVRQARLNPWLLPMALSFAAMNVCYLRSMTLTTAANAIWLQSTAPLWVFVLGTTVLRDKVNGRDLIPLFYGTLGIGLILIFELNQEQSAAGVLYGLASAVTYALVVMFMRGLRSENAAWLVAVNHLFTAMLIGPYVVYHGVWPTPLQLVVLAAFGFFQMALPYTLFARGLKTVSSQEATAIGLLEPVLLPAWVYLAWGESPSWWTIVGACMILAGLVIRYGRRERIVDPPREPA